MLLHHLLVCHYIIKICYDEDIEAQLEHYINIALEGCGCVC